MREGPGIYCRGPGISQAWDWKMINWPRINQQLLLFIFFTGGRGGMTKIINDSGFYNANKISLLQSTRKLLNRIDFTRSLGVAREVVILVVLFIRHNLFPNRRWFFFLCFLGGGGGLLSCHWDYLFELSPGWKTCIMERVLFPHPKLKARSKFLLSWLFAGKQHKVYTAKLHYFKTKMFVVSMVTNVVR